VLVHTIPAIGGGFIYVRSVTHSLEKLRRHMEQRGWRSGGKKSVAVFTYHGHNPPEKLLETLLEEASKLVEGE
jgi:hypothetical protein